MAGAEDGAGPHGSDGPTGADRPGGSGLLDGLSGRCRFPTGGPVDLAVSGGADSVALIVLARHCGLTGSVHHVDHGLRPGSEAEAGMVAATAERYGFGFVGHRVEVAPGPDLEARARRARYAILPPGILTGHTMDDQAETVLLNLMRGSGLDGVAAMAGAGPGRPAVGRPLLGLRRSETARVCIATGVRVLTDPTNSDPRFRRNRVRAELIPLLDDIAERDVVPLLARLAGVTAGDLALLDSLAREIDPTDVMALRAAPDALARRALRDWLRPAAGGVEMHPPSAGEIERVMAVVRGTRRACQIAGGAVVSRRAGRLEMQFAVPEGTKTR